jgi:hypothetical protein
VIDPSRVRMTGLRGKDLEGNPAPTGMSRPKRNVST